MTYKKPTNGTPSPRIYPQPARAKVIALQVATHYQTLRAPLMWLIVIYLFSALALSSVALASEEPLPEVAALPTPGEVLFKANKARPQPTKKEALWVRGVCSDGIAVFTVKNVSKRWAARGHLRIFDATTGQLLRQRWLRFATGQSASFRIGPDLVPGHRYRLIVTSSDGALTTVKNFRGRCPQPGGEVREARR